MSLRCLHNCSLDRISDPPSARSSYFSLLEKDTEDVSVYLDYNATTPLAHDVYMAVIHALKYNWANPSCTYLEGQNVAGIIEKARQRVAAMIEASSPSEIIFTSGGTEANYQVIYSIIQDQLHMTPNIIASNVEHDSIRKTLDHFVKQNLLSVTYVEVSHRTGEVDPEEIRAAIMPRTCLITIMMANNETGLIQPLEKISQVLKEVNKTRVESKHPKVLLHSDLAQAIGKIPVDIAKLGLDYGTIVGHKFYGPKVGALYVKKGAPLHPVFHGGSQERGFRPGTENSAMIVGIGKAATLVTNNLSSYQQQFIFMKNYLQEKLKEVLGNLVVFHAERFTGAVLPNTCSIGFNNPRLNGFTVLCHCKFLRASTGAACHELNGRPSAVLCAFGIPEDLAFCSIRLSLGRETTPDKIDTAVYDLQEAITRVLRENPQSP